MPHTGETNEFKKPVKGQDGEHMYTHGWFMWMYGKNHHNIVT